jgi:hypothetical protein
MARAIHEFVRGGLWGIAAILALYELAVWLLR